MRRLELEDPWVPSLPEGWSSHIHPQGWVYFYHPKIRVITNDDIRVPSVLDTVEKYIATYPFSDLADRMELLVPHNPQLDEHMFSLIVNHKSCLAGYDLKDVISTEGMEADQGAFYSMWGLHLTDLRPTVNKRRRMYWNHLERHPNHVLLPPNAEQEARDALAWFHLGICLPFFSGENSGSYLFPFKTTSSPELAAWYLSRSRSVKISWMQYLESVVRYPALFIDNSSLHFPFS